MTRQELLHLVDSRWHGDFVRFIETGDASEEFLAFMDRDPDCQRAVETAFSQQAADFEELSRSLRNIVSPEAMADAQASIVSQNMASVFEQTLQLPPDERNRVLRRTVSTLTQEGSAPRREELKEFVEALDRQVAAVG
jgi:hypothetical protein